MVKNNNPPGPLSGMGLGLGSRIIPKPFSSAPPSAPRFGLTGWDSASTNNMYLSQLFANGPYLNALSGPLLNNNQFGQGTAQGTCISPLFAQSIGTFYWEILWQNVDDPSAIGMGVANLGSSQSGNLSINQKVAIYSGLALNGTGDIILLASGDVLFDGNVQPQNFPEQEAGDTVGIFANIQPGGLTVTFLGVSGGVYQAQSSPFSISPRSCVPVLVYDSAISPNILTTANFGYQGFNSFLGPDIFGRNTFNNVTMGWPSSP